ncbi:hypothetical protein ID866_8795 [Astraeus odoratus]|nr:hypothetical protein ID866_8795 [Astraeus odoratus]
MGNTYSFVKELFFPLAPTITVEDIPDMTGKVVLVTGANTGIGKETARVLLTKNAKVWVTYRDATKGEAALKDLRESTGRDAHFLKLNLADLGSIKQSVKEFLNKETQLHVLCNNAGVMHAPVELLTDDGYDLQFGTNVLGHFYLTKLLLPILLSTAKSTSEGTVRVVNVSSCAHRLSKLNFDTFKDSRTIKSDLTRYSSRFAQSLYDLILYDVSWGALTQLYASTLPECENMGGKYLVAWGRLSTPWQETQDPDVGKELWTWLEEQVAGL